MPMLNDAVIQKPTFEKKASYELPKDIKNWNDEIMDQFYSEVDFLPQGANADIAINSVDENKGYAKGSVIIWYGDKRINYPVIVRDYQLFPFDVFTMKVDNETLFFNSTVENLNRVLMSSSLGTPEDPFPGFSSSIDKLKRPGNIAPKQSVNLSESTHAYHNNPLYKMSSLSHTWKKEDLQRFKETIEKDASVADSFVETTGDLASNIVELNNSEDQVVPEDQKKGKLDLNNIVTAKQVVTAIDSELFDVNNLMPVKAPAVCEMRLYTFPSMEDFMDRGASALSRFQAAKNGKPITGVVLDYQDSYRLNNRTGYQDNDRPQIFISSDGKYYSISRYNYGKPAFYGSDILAEPKLMSKIMDRIRNNTTDDYIRFDRENKNDGADKKMPVIEDLNQNSKENKPSSICPYRNDLLCIVGAGNAWECCEFGGSFKVYDINGSKVYVSSSNTLIPSKVANVQKVSDVSEDVYKMVIGNCKNIYLIPEGSIIINKQLMKSFDVSDFLTPDKPIKEMYEQAAISKVSMYLKDGGYSLKGKPLNQLKKIAMVNDGDSFNTNVTKHILTILGMEKNAIDLSMKTLLNRAQESGNDASVDIYGVNDNYINPNAFAGVEKTARIKELRKEYASELKKDMIKEASVIADPEAVDVVLSLNFVNEDNLEDYIDQTQTMNKTISKLASMLVASRMGLSDIDEGATRKAIDGLENVVSGLENLKIALGK